jgi:hypothetical protein
MGKNGISGWRKEMSGRETFTCLVWQHVLIQTHPTFFCCQIYYMIIKLDENLLNNTFQISLIIKLNENLQWEELNLYKRLTMNEIYIYAICNYIHPSRTKLNRYINNNNESNIYIRLKCTYFMKETIHCNIIWCYKWCLRVTTGLCQMSWVVFSGHDYQNVRFTINFSVSFPSRLVRITTCDRQLNYFRPKAPRTSYTQQCYTNNYENGCKPAV